jgi:hypothetical protein
VIPDTGGLGEWALRGRKSQYSLTTRWFGITHTSVIKSETPIQPVYMVLGIFPRGHSNPRELVVFIHKPEQLFWRLGWAAFRLRGLRSTFFSLRHVKSFRLYRVHTFQRRAYIGLFYVDQEALRGSIEAKLAVSPLYLASIGSLSFPFLSTHHYFGVFYMIYTIQSFYIQ